MSWAKAVRFRTQLMRKRMLLSSPKLLEAYSRGLFPMGDGFGRIDWYSPDPRGIIPLDGFHVPRRLRRSLRGDPFQMKINTAFQAVIESCAERIFQCPITHDAPLFQREVRDGVSED